MGKTRLFLHPLGISADLGRQRVGKYPAEEGRDGLVGIDFVAQRLLIARVPFGNLYGRSEAVEPSV